MEHPHHPERGDIYRVSFRGDDHELRGSHYAVVISEYPFTRLSTVIVVPLSSHAEKADFRVELTVNNVRTRALVDQITAVSRRRLGEPLGSLAGSAMMTEIEDILRDVLGLEER